MKQACKEIHASFMLLENQGRLIEPTSRLICMIVERSYYSGAKRRHKTIQVDFPVLITLKMPKIILITMLKKLKKILKHLILHKFTFFIVNQQTVFLKSLLSLH